LLREVLGHVLQQQRAQSGLDPGQENAAAAARNRMGIASVMTTKTRVSR